MVVLAIADSKILEFMKKANIDLHIHHACFGKIIPPPGLLIASPGSGIQSELSGSMESLAQNSANIIATYYGLERGDDLHEQWAKIYDYRSPNAPTQFSYESSEINAPLLSKVWEHFGTLFSVMSSELSRLVWSEK